MGSHTSTLKSLLTLKEEIRARDPLFRVFIDITKSLICVALFLFLLHTKHENLFDFPKFWFHLLQAIFLMGFEVIKELWLILVHVVILL